MRLHRPVRSWTRPTPTGATRELDLYAAGSPNQPPYPTEFLERYRAAQLARVRRITASVKERLGALRAAGRPNDERAFVVHGTLADPRVLDPSIDPNEREPGVSFLGDPRVVNDGPIGLARFCSLRSWLSQWSVDDANADGVRAAARRTRAGARGQQRRRQHLHAGLRRGGVRGARQRGQVRAEDRRSANHYYIGPDQREHLGAVRDGVHGMADRAGPRAGDGADAGP